MRVRSCFMAVALVSLAGAPVSAQDVPGDSSRSLSLNASAGLSRYGPHVTTALDYSMNRWLATRGELFFGRNWTNDPMFSRMTAVNVAAVVSAPEIARITPYLLGGYGLSFSQGIGPTFGPLGGGGLRFRIGRISPYIETRAQRLVGVPISLGIRF